MDDTSWVNSLGAFMKLEIRTAETTDIPFCLKHLRQNGVRNAWAIQDLTVWPERSKFFFNSDPFSYVLISGHPASHGHPTVIAEGDPTAVASLLQTADIKIPFVIRETSAHLLPVLKNQYPSAKIYVEQRMDVTTDSFRPKHKGTARNLNPGDAEALAQFFGAPPQAAGKFKGWLSGAKAFFGVFEGSRLAAIGSSMVSVPEAWNLVSIETHKDFRRKGYATEVTSSLVERALKETATVTVTVVKGNAPAIHTYEKLGFKFAEDRIWLDNGTGSAP
jgi:ribosomal protein S18 acetylase RimI-like enzyme